MATPTERELEDERLTRSEWMEKHYGRISSGAYDVLSVMVLTSEGIRNRKLRGIGFNFLSPPMLNSHGITPEELKKRTDELVRMKILKEPQAGHFEVEDDREWKQKYRKWYSPAKWGVGGGRIFLTAVRWIRTLCGDCTEYVIQLFRKE